MVLYNIVRKIVENEIIDYFKQNQLNLTIDERNIKIDKICRIMNDIEFNFNQNDENSILNDCAIVSICNSICKYS